MTQGVGTMKAPRLLLPAMLAMALVPLAAGRASAASPGNDEATGAVTLVVGHPVTQDTTEATTNAADDALNLDNCGAPATNASVWYQYSPSVPGNVVLDATASSYSAGLMVFKGTPTDASFRACGPGLVGLHLKAGKTYTIMAFSDTVGVIGGTLVLSLKNAPTPRVHVSVAKPGVASHGGAARIHGRYSCTHDMTFAGVAAHLYQRAGRLKIQADSETRIRCNGMSHHWSARLVSQVGTYAEGHAVAKVAIDVCGLLVCREDTAKSSIHLVWAAGSKRRWMMHPPAARPGRPHPMIGRERRWPRS
jgi:hypothetical protein